MQGFDFKELLSKFRYPILILLIGLIFIGGGYFLFNTGITSGGTKVEVLPARNASQSDAGGGTVDITTEIAGEVITPGVYKLPSGSRINDLLVLAGGLSSKADREWTDKYLNRASKLTDGQKVYIPSVNQQSNNTTANKTVGDQTVSSPIVMTGVTPVNINTASVSELDTLPGIGPVFGQKIIEQRPYSTVQELVSKGVLNQSLYNKVKDLVTTY